MSPEATNRRSTTRRDTAVPPGKDAKDEREYKDAFKPELKGKDYVVADGDILNIRSGV